MKLLLSLLLPSFLLLSCGQSGSVSSADASKTPVGTKDMAASRPGGPVTGAISDVSVKTFEVKDSTGKSLGWGYDLYANGKATIHQPHFPGVSGIKSFKTEAQALACGTLAASKLKKTGAFPTVEIKELDSLHIDYK